MAMNVRFSAPARNDIIDILEWSAAKFGEAARTRYEGLLDLAIRKISEEPTGHGAHERAEISSDLWVLHLRAVEGGAVRDPRHIVFYRFDTTTVRIVRVLHEARELSAALLGQ